MSQADHDRHTPVDRLHIAVVEFERELAAMTLALSRVTMAYGRVLERSRELHRAAQGGHDQANP